MPNTLEKERTRARSRPRKDDVIQIRTTAETKAVLKRAADLKGKKLSEFILESARREAEDAILDQRLFILDSETHQRFLRMLDQPAEPSEDLRRRMHRRPVWEP